MKNPLISIVTINLNNLKGLQRSIESFEKYRNNTLIEFIFIDGQSNDGSLEVAERFYSKDKIISEKDNGIYDAMNKGLLKSKGKFILWINSGDELNHANNFNETLRKLQTRYNDYDVVGFGILKKRSTRDKHIQIDIPDVNMLPNCSFPHQSTIFNRKSVLEMNGYNIKYKICADRDLLIRMHKSEKRICNDSDLISIFYLDGISSNNDTYPENLKINHDNRIINTLSYVSKRTRYKAGEIKKRILSTFLRKSF